MSSPPAQSRVRRALTALSLSLVFAASAVGGVFAHLDLPLTRRVVGWAAQGILNDALPGRFEVGAIEGLSWRGLQLRSFVAASAEGQELLRVEDLRLRGNWLGSLLSLALHGGGQLELGEVRIERASLRLEIERGELTLANAFAAPNQVPEPEPATPPPRGEMGLGIARIEIGTIDVRGSLGDAVPLESRVSHIAGRFALDSDQLSLDVDRSSIRDERVLGAPTQGTVDFYLRAPMSEAADVADAGRRHVSMSGSFLGHVGELEIGVRASYDEGEVAVAANLPKVGSAELKPWVPTGPLTVPVSARASFSGVPPLFRLQGQVDLPAVRGSRSGALSMDGHLRLSDVGECDVRVVVEHLNTQLFGDSLPASDLSSQAQVQARIAGAQSQLVALARVLPSSMAGEPLPAMGGQVRLSQTGIEAQLQLEEEGSPADADLIVAGGGASFAVRASADDLSAAPRLARLLSAISTGSAPRGRATLRARGSLAGDRLDVASDAALGGLDWRAADVAAGSAQIHARVQGPLDKLTLRADGRVSALRTNGQSFASVEMSAQGPIRRPRVNVALQDERGRDIAGSATVDTDRAELQQLRVEVARGDSKLSGAVARVRLTPGGVQIDDIVVEGLGGGRADGSLRIVGGEPSGKLVAKDLDLEALSQLLGLDARPRGRADVDLDVTRDRDGRHGHVTLTLRDAGYLMLSGVNAEMHAELDGDRIVPNAEVNIALEPKSKGDRCGGTIAAFGLDQAEGTLPGPMLLADSWMRLTGKGRLSVRGLKLQCLSEYVPVPLERLEGQLNASVDVSRESLGVWPSLDNVVLRTTGLAVAPLPGKDEQTPAWVSDRIDVALTGALDGATGSLEAALHLIDAKASSAQLAHLAQLSGSIELDLDAIDRGGEAALQSLTSAPIALRFETERRAIESFEAIPTPWRDQLATVRGDVQVGVFVDGSVADPSLATRVRGWQLVTRLRRRGAGAPGDAGARGAGARGDGSRARARSSQSRPSEARAAATGGRRGRWSFPIDVDAMANYHAAVGRLDASILHEGELVANLEGTSKGDLAARMLGGHDERWTGSLIAKLRGLPLSALSGVARQQLGGKLSGTVALEGLGDKPRLSARLSGEDLSFGSDLVFQSVSLRAEPAPGQDDVMTLESALNVRGGGRLNIAGYGTIRYDDELFPYPDQEQPAALYLKAQRFPVHSLTSLLPQDQVTNLGGELNGELRLAYREILGREVALDADMVLTDGTVHLPSLGHELYDVGAHIHSDGRLLVVDDIRASAESGTLEGKLTARFSGLEFKDLTGSFHIPEDRPMPLALQGVPLGVASMRQLVVNASRLEDELQVVMTLDGLRVQLPGSASRDVQALEAHPDVTISHPLTRPKRRRDLQEESTPIQLTLSVSDAEMEGESVRIAFATSEGKPIRLVTTEEQISGELSLNDGELVLMGKVFEIDRGFVRMRPEERDNPYVSMTAHWTAPDGSTVFVDYVGPLRPITRDKLTFRSTPPRSQNELIALLLFGDSQSGARIGSATAARREGIAAEQLSVPLGQIAPGVSTSVARGSDGVTSSTLVYQLNDRVTARATVESQGGERDATATEGGPNNNSSGGATRISIDWRFAKSWLLRGSFSLGDSPTSGVDLLFQHRYE